MRPGAQRITVVSASVGAGHDGAAAELARRLTERGFEVDCHDFLDMLPVALGRVLRRAYALQLRVAPGSWGWLLSVVGRHRSLTVAAGGLCRVAAKRLRRIVPAGTAAVVSTYPLASQALGGMRSCGLLDAPVITYLTDMSVHPLWVSGGADAHLALHPVAAFQAKLLGAAAVHVAGPAVPPNFRPAESVTERRAAQLRFGLPHEHLPLALVVAGSWGVGDVEQTACDITATGLATPVVLCGHNQALRDAITRGGAGIALGWVEDMPALLRACHVVIQNAGGLSCLEALAAGLPVISYRCLPGHGATNAAALDLAGWARWAQGPNELADLLSASLAPPLRPAGAPTVDADPAAIIAGLARPGLAPVLRLNTGTEPVEQPATGPTTVTAAAGGL
jgi:UDP-N-acetylglucosamine:LPS N-acetylglucosamine transferase